MEETFIVTSVIFAETQSLNAKIQPDSGYILSKKQDNSISGPFFLLLLFVDPIYGTVIYTLVVVN